MKQVTYKSDDEIPVRPIETDSSRRNKARRGLRYLKQHDLEPILRAACQKSSALALYLAVLHRTDVSRSDTVTLSRGYLLEWGITSRDLKKRSLRELETAGLVAVERSPGRSARVKVLPPPAPASDVTQTGGGK